MTCPQFYAQSRSLRPGPPAVNGLRDKRSLCDDAKVDGNEYAKKYFRNRIYRHCEAFTLRTPDTADNSKPREERRKPEAYHIVRVTLSTHS